MKTDEKMINIDEILEVYYLPAFEDDDGNYSTGFVKISEVMDENDDFVHIYEASYDRKFNIKLRKTCWEAYKYSMLVKSPDETVNGKISVFSYLDREKRKNQKEGLFNFMYPNKLEKSSPRWIKVMQRDSKEGEYHSVYIDSNALRKEMECSKLLNLHKIIVVGYSKEELNDCKLRGKYEVTIFLDDDDNMDEIDIKLKPRGTESDFPEMVEIKYVETIGFPDFMENVQSERILTMLPIPTCRIPVKVRHSGYVPKAELDAAFEMDCTDEYINNLQVPVYENPTAKVLIRNMKIKDIIIDKDYKFKKLNDTIKSLK